MDILKTTIQIGLPSPVKILHITDSHLCYANPQDGERKLALAKERQSQLERRPDQAFQNFQNAVLYANDHCDLLVHTGDMIDFVSDENLKLARGLMDSSKNFFYVTGNHEFYRYVGEGWESQSFKMDIYPTVRAGLGRDMFFSDQEIKGLNIVGFDNGYHQFEPWQLDRLRREAAKGLPIILVMHSALFEQALFEKSLAEHQEQCAWVTGCDEDHLLQYDEYHQIQQRPTPDTLRFIDYVQSQPLIKAVVAGHLHLNFESRLPGGTMQYVTNACVDGFAREITVI